MARKGNRQRNGLDRNTPSHKNAVSGSMDASLSENKKENSQERNRKIIDADLSTDDPQCRLNSPSEGRVKDTKFMASGKRNKQRSSSVHCREKSENGTSDKFESVDTCGQGRDTVGTDILSDFSESRIDETISYGSSKNSKNTTRNIEDVFVENMNNCRPSEVVSIQHLRMFFLHVLKRAKEWIEQQKPRFKVFTTSMSDAHSYIRVKVEYAYPLIWTWVKYFGKLMFVLCMVWLDCNIRGFDSLLHLGTTSFLTVLWCGILSVTAMIGITKMLIIMVINALLVFFTGFAFAIITTTVLAVVTLWLYGSFWTTGFIIFLGGIALALRHERVALFVMTLYSMHCARSYVGWFGLVLGLNLAFISTDVLLHLLKNKTNAYRSNIHPEHARESQGRAGPFSSEPLRPSSTDDAFYSEYGRSADHSQSVPSTSGSETELTSDDEVIRLLNCHDHYSALGLNRYDNIDVSSLKKEYRKKAMLVHPDKNMGNEKAAEAFKKLQNAYEVLLDSLKRKTYDDELRREELLDYIRRFQSASQKNGRRGIFGSGFSNFEAGDEGSSGESRRIACKKCGDFHIWRHTMRSKSRARWCQDCKEFHQAKDGDGWAEQSFQPLLFGLLQKMDPLCVYVCAESRIYDATEWFVCQGIRCPPNTHKPSFHVNASIISKHSNGKGTGSSHRGSGGMPTADMDETMTEEEFFEWLQNAVQSGMFEASNMPNDSPSARSGSGSRSGTKKRKGKKQ